MRGINFDNNGLVKSLLESIRHDSGMITLDSDLDLTTEYISPVNRTQLITHINGLKITCSAYIDIYIKINHNRTKHILPRIYVSFIYLSSNTIT